MDVRERRQPGQGGRTLWLVRHGESTWNALGLVQGQTSAPRLTRRGVGQARAVARLLADRPVGRLFSSDLQRTVQTARPIAAGLGLDPIRDARLRERSFGRAEGTPVRSLLPALSGIADGRVVDADAAPPGGESVRQLVARVGGFLDELWDGAASPEPGGGDVVLVVHGGVVRAAVAHLDGVAPDGMSWGPVGNGALVARPFPDLDRPSPSPVRAEAV